MARPLPSADFSIPVFKSQPFETAHGASAAHGFFGRVGGVSKGVYNSLNCGPGSDDDIENVLQNRRIVADTIGAEEGNILTLYQVHGDTCLKVSEPWSVHHRPEADCMVTDAKGLALGISTADCAPVLFYAENDGKPVIGAAHAGWKGALGGALEATIRAMGEYGAKPEDICAAIGPCIDKKSYEVSEEFQDGFLKEDPANERFFSPARKPFHLMFDLAGYCAAKLSKNGLRNVFIKDIDTYFNEEDFFSYRRATHRAEKDYGRQISLIMLR